MVRHKARNEWQALRGLNIAIGNQREERSRRRDKLKVELKKLNEEIRVLDRGAINVSNAMAALRTPKEI